MAVLEKYVKVLIADDSSLLRKNLRKLLAPVQTIETIVESHSVLSTIKQVEVEKPDVVILDIQMPDGSGIDVLTFLNSKDPKPLTIILTNFPSENNKHYCIERGADYFFDKSNEYEQVITVLENCKRRTK